MKKYNPWPAVIFFFCVLILAFVFLTSQAHAVTFFYAPIAAEGGTAETGTWETVWSDDNNFQDYGSSPTTYRQLLTAALSAAGGPWTKIRITFDGCRATDPIKASVCIRDSGDDCIDAPTAVTVSGSTGWNQGTSDVLSDELTFAFDTDDELLISVYSTVTECYWYESGWTNYYLSGDQVQTQAPSGTASTDTYRDYIWLIEGWNPD